MATVRNIRAYKVGVYVAVITLLTYTVSTCTAERSFSSMNRLKTPLRSTYFRREIELFSNFTHLQHKDVDIDDVITE